jgi:hypothetical protein
MSLETVRVPPEVETLFARAEEIVSAYSKNRGGRLLAQPPLRPRAPDRRVGRVELPRRERARRDALGRHAHDRDGGAGRGRLGRHRAPARALRDDRGRGRGERHGRGDALARVRAVLHDDPSCRRWAAASSPSSSPLSGRPSRSSSCRATPRTSPRRPLAPEVRGLPPEALRARSSSAGSASCWTGRPRGGERGPARPAPRHSSNRYPIPCTVTMCLGSFASSTLPRSRETWKSTVRVIGSLS